MTLGLPTNQADWPTFRWTPVQSASGPVDPNGIPYDLTSSATVKRKADVQVPCAIRYSAGQVSDTPLGEFDTTKPVLTILDTDYAQVVGADKVLLGGTVYQVSFVAPPEALYDLGVYTVYLEADSTGDHKLTRT